MKLERSKEWWMARAREEGDVVVSAGTLSQVAAGTADERSTRAIHTPTHEKSAAAVVAGSAEPRSKGPK